MIGDGLEHELTDTPDQFSGQQNNNTSDTQKDFTTEQGV